MNWFLRSPASPLLSLAPAPPPPPAHHVKYFLLCSSDIIDWLQIFPVKYFWSVCALNIFYLSGMIEPWPPMWQDGVFYWAQRILDKLSAGSAVTKFRYKLTIEMSPATTSANHRPATWTPDLCWPMRGEELPDDKIMVITGREIMTRSETCRHCDHCTPPPPPPPHRTKLNSPLSLYKQIYSQSLVKYPKRKEQIAETFNVCLQSNPI